MTGYCRQWTTTLAIAVCALALLPGVCGAYTPGDPEFRAFWVDAWHDGALNQGGVDKMLGVPGTSSTGDIRDANCNAIVLQVRRNADALYPSHMGEPYMSGISPANFNGLQAVINAAHDTTGGKKRIEVHCWIVTFRTSGGTVYALHDDPPTGSLTTLDNYWPSRDSSGAEVSDKAFDPGHPLCEEYLVNVAMDLVNNFDIDGIHYDYVRFTANNQGYNPTSVARYNARYGLTGQPANVAGTHGAGDPSDQWDQWRRDQVSAVVRKVYAKIQSVKPWVKQSGSFVTWNPSPTSSTRSAFQGTRPYYDVYCDWDSWLQEGIVDAAVPMTYYDLTGPYPNDWTRWMNWEKDRHGTRHMYIGPGLYMNSLSSSITELQQTRTASPAGNYADGFCGYSYWLPYVGGNWTDFAPTFITQVATSPVVIPVMPWKLTPTKGHISGTVTVAVTGAWADGATVTISGPENRSMVCDGTGFYAFIDLTPGAYTVTASKPRCISNQKPVTVAIGSVTGNMYVTDLAIQAPPTIINVRVTDIGSNSATIAWTTDQASSSQVEYSLDTSYGLRTPLNSTLVTSHSVTLSGLNANTLYHYRAVSANSVGSTASADYTFITGSFALTLTPTPTAGGSCGGGGFYVGGASVSAFAAANTGYGFISWSTSPDGTGVVSNANPYVFNMPNNNYTLYANLETAVADIIIEAWGDHGQGKNPTWYSDFQFAYTSVKSSAAGLTAGIGARYSLIGSSVSGREAHYKPEIAYAGWYQVWVTWGTQPSGGSSIKHTVTHRDGQDTVSFAQNSKASTWNEIGTDAGYPFLAGSSGNCGELMQWASAIQSGRRIIADAAKWVYIGPFKAINPDPADAATDVSSSNPTLSWAAGGTTDAYDVYFGTNPASMAKVSSAQTGTTYSADMLASTTRYYWRVVSICMGKLTTGDTWSFTTVAVPPVISNVVVTNISSSGATISWTTDQESTTQVEYGTTSAYGQATTEDTSLLTSHSVTLTGLTPITVHHFRVRSTNALALTGYSADSTFATKLEPFTFIVDNPQGVLTGTWTPLTDSGGWPIDASQYVYASNTLDLSSSTFKWRPSITVAGKYNVYCWYKTGTDRTTSARYNVYYAPNMMLTSVVNQALTGSQWVPMSSNLPFTAGTTGYVELTCKTGEPTGTKKVIADAIKFEYAENDITPPSVPTNLAVTGVSTSGIGLTWSPSTDNYALLGYKVYRDSQVVAITASPGYSDTNLTANTLHSYRVSAYDASNNESAQCSAVSRYTLSPPLTAADIHCDRNTGQPYATPPFTFTNLGFGPGRVTNYRYAWDNTATHTWTQSETSWTTSQKTVNATNTMPWYFHAKGYNGDGVSNGTLNIGPYYYGIVFSWIADAMNNPNTTRVTIGSFKSITMVAGSYFYIEEPNRTRALRIDLATALPVGKGVKVTGTLSTVSGERHLVDAIITDSTDGSAPRPVLMRANAMGGKAPDLYTPGLPGAKGMYNIGLLVRILGKVVSHGTGWLVISDGSGVTVKIYSTKALLNGTFVGATGVCSVESGACVLRTRTVDDVVVYSP